MKRVLIFAAVLGLLVLSGGIPFKGTDVAKLKPIEVIGITKEENEIVVKTDTEDQGRGVTLQEAFKDLKESASGQVFLETAQYLLIGKDLIPLLPELKNYLRPACNICLWDGRTELTEVTAYLDEHHPGLSLLDCLAENQKMPVLQNEQGRLYLEWQ